MSVEDAPVIPAAHQRQRWISRRRRRFAAASLRREAWPVEVWWWWFEVRATGRCDAGVALTLAPLDADDTSLRPFTGHILPLRVSQTNTCPSAPLPSGKPRMRAHTSPPSVRAFCVLLPVTCVACAVLVITPVSLVGELIVLLLADSRASAFTPSSSQASL
jgi:hypothetical protein